MSSQSLEDHLKRTLSHYQQSFHQKDYLSENNETDVLMDIFGLTPDVKRENRQYWGRELGMCWQRLVSAVFEHQHHEFAPPLRIDEGEPCDFIFSRYAVDTKYRIGSGDSGTLKKMRAYGQLLQVQSYVPVLLILRSDNLPSAITACQKGGWAIYIGASAFDFIQTHTTFDLYTYLTQTKGGYKVDR